MLKMKRSWIVRLVLAVLAMLTLSKPACGGWWPSFGSGSVGSGSSGSRGLWSGAKAEVVREVFVGGQKVLLPDNGTEVMKVDDRKVIWALGGNQVITTQPSDVVEEAGVLLPKVGSTDQWTYTYGSTGNVMVYQAKHKTAPNLYVHGTAEDERMVKAILHNVRIEVPPSTQPAK